MKKKETSCSILRNLNLDDIEEVVSEAYHQEGAGRPPRKPISIFKGLTSNKSSRNRVVPDRLTRAKVKLK